MTEDEPCPVCGWGVIQTEHIPENPDPDNGPHAPGTQYVHEIVAIGNGRFRLSGCSQYENGETDPWNPTSELTDDELLELAERWRNETEEGEYRHHYANELEKLVEPDNRTENISE